jgi:hypothetical protein
MVPVGHTKEDSVERERSSTSDSGW